MEINSEIKKNYACALHKQEWESVDLKNINSEMNQNVCIKSEPFKSEIYVEQNVEISVKLCLIYIV